MQKFLTAKHLVIGGAALLLVLLLILLVPSLYDTYDSAKVTSGVKLNHISLGGKTPEEISLLLDEEIARSKMVKILVSDQVIDLDLNSAGFSLDKEQTLQTICQMGKGNFLEALKIRFFHTPVTATVVSDKEMFTTVMETLLTEQNLSSQKFDYTLDGTQANITLKPDVPSYDISKLYDAILADYPMILKEYTMEEMPFSPPTSQEIADAINVPVVDARLEKKDGKTIVIPHQVGLSLDEEVLQEKLALGEMKFQVPIKVLKPKVYTDDLADDAFPNRLASYTTHYNEGEVSRSSNVKLAARKVNGTVLNSGEIFSFNKVVGQRSYENGFKDAKIFLSDKVVDGTGGGICQVSSTIYPAALYSNLKIVERKNHNFVVSYAKAGIDATVVYGSIDFKFQNTLQNPIRIKAYASNGNMTVEIWGTKENDNTVELTTQTLGSTAREVKYVYNEDLAPGVQKVTQGGYDGLKVQAYRIVKDAKGNVIRQDNLGVSNYVPLAKLIETSDRSLVETGIPGEVPEESPTPSEEPTQSPDTEPASPPPTETPEATPAATPGVISGSTPAPSAAPVQDQAALRETPAPTPAPTLVPGAQAASGAAEMSASVF